MSCKDTILSRHSVRNFRPDPIPQGILDDILEAGRRAPSTQNRQPWRFIVLRNPEKIKAMAKHCGLIGLANYFIRNAPCVIVACADPTKDLKINKQDYYLVDTAIAFHQMMLMAWQYGIGSCWLGAFSEKPLHKWLQLPSSWRIVALSPFGYPADNPNTYAKLVKTFADSENRLPIDKIISYLG
jgi:nitroreductase